MYQRNSNQRRGANNRRGSSSRQQKAALWGLLAGGGALAAFGAMKRGWPGAALAAAGGLMMVGGARMRSVAPGPIHVERSFTINRPVEEIYQFWRNFENLPKFMRHLKSVEAKGGRFSRWSARAPMGASISWDAEIVEEEANKFIVWRSVPGSMLPNSGSVQFLPAAEYHGGTEVRVTLDYQPPAGRAGSIFATLFGEDADQQIREDLRRFKQLMEAGEIPTTEGQPHGRRSAFVRMVQAVASDEPKPGENPNWKLRNVRSTASGELARA